MIEYGLFEEKSSMIKGVHTMFYSSEPEALRADIPPEVAGLSRF
jgi:hypothetical protein